MATKIIKASKCQSWRDFCSTLNETSKFNSIWRVVNKLNNKYKSEKLDKLKVGDEEYTDELGKANILAESFAKVSSTANYSKEFKDHKVKFEKENHNIFLKKKNDKSILNVDFKMSELKKAL